MYIIYSSKNYSSKKLFTTLSTCFTSLFFSVTSINIDDNSNFVNIINNSTDDNCKIIISDFNIFDFRLLKNIERFYIFMYNVPAELTYKNIYNLIVFDHTTISNYQFFDNGFYVKNNEIMILWGSYLPQREIINNNYLYFSNEIVPCTEIYCTNNTDTNQRTLFKKEFNDSYIVQKIVNEDALYKNNNVFVFNCDNQNIFTLLSYNNDVITNSKLAQVIFGDNICYVEDMSTMLAKIKQFDWTDRRKKMNVYNLINDKYLMIHRCTNIIDFCKLNVII